MYSWQQRSGTVLAFAITAAFGLIPLIMLTTVMLPASPIVKMTLNDVQLYRGVESPYMPFKTPIGHFSVNLDADFGPLFNWNVKLLYVYMVVEYSTPDRNINQVVMWDDIVERGSTTRIIDADLSNEYPVTDFDVSGLLDREAQLKLYWNTVPNVGALFDTQHGRVVSFKFPAQVAR